MRWDSVTAGRSSLGARIVHIPPRTAKVIVKLLFLLIRSPASLTCWHISRVNRVTFGLQIVMMEIAYPLYFPWTMVPWSYCRAPRLAVSRAISYRNKPIIRIAFISFSAAQACNLYWELCILCSPVGALALSVSAVLLRVWCYILSKYLSLLVFRANFDQFFFSVECLSMFNVYISLDLLWNRFYYYYIFLSIYKTFLEKNV